METVLSTIWGLLIPGGSLLIIWFGGYLVLRGKATTGDFFAFQIYVVMLIQPVWAIINRLSHTQRSLAAMERVFDVLAMPPDKPYAPDADYAPQPGERLVFHG